MIRLIVVGNFDSFMYNFVEYFSKQTVGGEPLDIGVRKSTAPLDEIRDLNPDVIVISPGSSHPKNDRDVGVTSDVLTELSTKIPTPSTYLGLEVAVYAYGGTIDHAPEPIHGEASLADHDGAGVFAGLEGGFPAGHYHSLVAMDVPDRFGVSATTDHDDEALVMGVRRRDYSIECVQFHPESVFTGSGYDIVGNFLAAITSFDVV